MGNVMRPIMNTDNPPFDLMGDFAINGTFTRASTANYVDSDQVIKTAAINIPRYEYDLDTGDYLGLLVEEARTNICLHNTDLTDAVWTMSDGASVTANQATAPDGTMTADLVDISDGSGSARLFQSTQVVTSGTDLCMSVYLKAVSGSGTFPIAGFNGSTQVDSNGTANTVDLVSITDAKWTRFDLPMTSASSVTPCGLYPANSRHTTGNTLDTAYVWIPQLEVTDGACSSPIYTTTVAVTRASEIAKLTDMSWYNESEGTFVLESVFPQTSGTTRAFYRADDGSFDNLVRATMNVTLQNLIRSGAADSASFTNSPSQDTPFKTATSYKVSDFKNSYNGGTIATDVTGSVPVGVSQIGIGCDASGGQELNGHIKTLKYYGESKTSEQLKGLST